MRADASYNFSLSKNQTIVNKQGQALTYYTYIDPSDNNTLKFHATWELVQSPELLVGGIRIRKWDFSSYLRICLEIGEEGEQFWKRRMKLRW